MERTKLNDAQINVLAETVARLRLASQLGTSFGGQRDLYQTFGYKKDLSYEDYIRQYKRQDIAKAIIKRPVEATWAGELHVSEYGASEDTEFEQEWTRLEKRLKLKNNFARLDRLTCLGKYGVLLLGFSDTPTIQDFAEPVTQKKGLSLLYVKPLGEGSAKIDSFEDNTNSSRFGKPLFYNITVKLNKSESPSTLKVHHSRVLHVAWDLMEDENEGTPIMEAVFNRLQDLEKLIGGSAEMFWRGARPGFQGKVDPEYSMSDAQIKALQEKMDEYEHNLRRFFIQEGIELKSLAPQISDPTPHVTIQIQMISAVTGIPQRILLGSEKGELSSDQDATMWKVAIQDRRLEQVEPCIIRPFVEKMLEYNILPQPKTKDFMVLWSDLFAPSEKERAETGKTRAAAVQQYLQNPMAIEVLPPDVFIELFLGLTKEQITLVHKMREKAGVLNLELDREIPSSEEEEVQQE